MSKQKKRPQPFNPSDLALLAKARREENLVSFVKGRPVIVDRYPKQEPPAKSKTKPDTPQVGGETVNVKPCSLLSPIVDVLMMVDTLELFAAHCSDRLSEIEHRREDCTHLLEPQRNESTVIGEMAPDEMILAIGKKLQRIGAERRNIKNRFEVIKSVKRGFASSGGREALTFLRNLVAEAEWIEAKQRQRTYTPRTDELDSLFDKPLPKYIDPKNAPPDLPDEYPEEPFVNPESLISKEELTQLLHETEASVR